MGYRKNAISPIYQDLCDGFKIKDFFFKNKNKNKKIEKNKGTYIYF
jgi:hypothetical protein